MHTTLGASPAAAVPKGLLAGEIAALTPALIEKGLGIDIIRIIGGSDDSPESRDLLQLLTRVFETPRAAANLETGVAAFVSWLQEKRSPSGKLSLLSFLLAGIYLGYRLAWLQLRQQTDATN